MTDVRFPYTAREWTLPLHAKLSSGSVRAIVAVVHRRGGKTYFGIACGLMLGLQKSISIGIVGPQRQAMYEIAWPIILEYLKDVPDVQIAKGSMTITFPAADGGRSSISIHSAGDDDTGSNIRGRKFHFLFVDEVANIGTEAFWGEVWPTQANLDNPIICICGTPRGEDILAELYREGERRPDWHSVQLGVRDTNLLSETEIKDLEETMPTEQYLREMDARMDVGSSSQLNDVKHVIRAQENVVSKADMQNLQMNFDFVVGVDVGRLNDEAVIAVRLHTCIVELIRLETPTTQELAMRIRAVAEQYQAENVFVDSGAMGIAVVDVCHQLGCDAIPINFGQSASDPDRYAQKRAELFDRTREWLTHPDASLPQGTKLRKEISAPHYSMNAANKLQIEAKDKIRKRLGHSTDALDAIALTFAGSSPISTKLAHQLDFTLAKHSWEAGSENAVLERGVDGSVYSSNRRTMENSRRGRTGYVILDEEFDPYD